jgi:addiction module RelB/DinJ family antitoxin
MGVAMGLDATVQFRTDSAVKDGAFAVFREMGISPSTAMQLFLQQVQRTRTLPFIVTANQAEEGKEEGKEEGYDEWLRDRLERTIKMLDSGEMKTHTLDEVRSYIRTERAKRRQERGIITNAL